jgi:curli biogenesis system outer membrane secretion channel CsgG
MKRILPLLAFFLSAAVFSANAQETKSKPITTPSDKVHNVIHPKNKVSHGTKFKHKTATGKKKTVVAKTDEAVPMEPKKKTPAK